MTKIGIIVGSTRPGRFGIQPATWIHTLAQERKDATFTLLDLQTINLPLLDEPLPPAMNQYANDHTKNWAKTIGELDGFIIVTPEYNHGVPAALKNALDFIAKEWNYKPVAFVSYGADAGGTRAVEHLRSIVAWIRMYDLSEQVLIPNYWAQLGEDGTFQPSEPQTLSAQKLLDSIIFWSTEMSASRQKLEKKQA